MQRPDRPLLIIVNGLPASGKTTLAGKIADRLKLPLFAKDAIKERLYDAEDAIDRSSSRALGAAALKQIRETAETMLGSGQSLIVEANFDPAFSGPWIVGIEQRFSPVTAQVFLTADSATILDRYIDRANAGDRHPCHMDDVAVEELRERLKHPLQPLEIEGPTLTVDTTRFEDVDIYRIICRLAEISGIPAV